MWGQVATREDAVAWGEKEVPGLKVTEELGNFARLHEAEMNEAGGFEELVRKKFNSTLSARLNTNRVQATLSRSNPEYERMMSLATGIVAPVATGFKPVSTPPPKTTLYEQVFKAVDAI
jgi:hypothetical protein